MKAALAKVATKAFAPNLSLPRAQQSQAQPIAGVRFSVSQESTPIFESNTRLATGFDSSKDVQI
uniref:G-protein coupled receptors family 1 profile domain-containing protein n=1 Tax=Parascaris univalens TaxID=6257 RepID=A0A915AVT2_PARUN